MKTFYIIKVSYFRKGHYVCFIFNKKTKALKFFNNAKEGHQQHIDEKESLITITVLQFETTQQAFDLIEKNKRNELLLNPEILQKKEYDIVNVLRNTFVIL